MKDISKREEVLSWDIVPVCDMAKSVTEPSEQKQL